MPKLILIKTKWNRFQKFGLWRAFETRGLFLILLFPGYQGELVGDEHIFVIGKYADGVSV